MKVEFLVPGEVRGKGRPRATARGGFARVYTDDKTMAYESLIRRYAAQAMGDQLPTTEPVSLSLYIQRSIPASWSKRKRQDAEGGRLYPVSKPDADNVLKAVADACNSIVYRDDAQIVDVTLRKRYGPRDGLTVAIEAVAQTNGSTDQEDNHAS